MGKQRCRGLTPRSGGEVGQLVNPRFPLVSRAGSAWSGGVDHRLARTQQNSPFTSGHHQGNKQLTMPIVSPLSATALGHPPYLLSWRCRASSLLSTSPRGRRPGLDRGMLRRLGAGAGHRGSS